MAKFVKLLFNLTGHRIFGKCHAPFLLTVAPQHGLFQDIWQPPLQDDRSFLLPTKTPGGEMRDVHL